MIFGLTHASRPTTWAEASTLATECDESFFHTRLTLGSQKPVSQNPTLEIFVKLFNYEIWQWIAGIKLNLGLKREPIVLNYLIESGLFRPVPIVGKFFELKI